MKAIVHTEYGPPEELQLIDVEKPVPNVNEVLVKIHATTVTTSDCNMRNLTFVPKLMRLPMRMQFGFKSPTNSKLGFDLAGEVEAVGDDVQRFRAGDGVFGTAEPEMGAHAQYICLPADRPLATKPSSASWEESAALVTMGVTALYFIRHLGNVQWGQDVLINGASGGIGTFAVQLAKHFGARVTGVCSTANLDLVKSLGADHVIDYTKKQFTHTGQLYDVIFDAAGKSSYSRCKTSLKEEGQYLDTLPKLSSLLNTAWTSIRGGKRVKMEGAVPTVERLDYLADLVDAGELKVVIDRRYSLDRIAEAFHYVEQGHKTGSVVIAVTHEEDV